MTAHRSLDIEALKHIGLMGGIKGEVRLTSAMMAKALSLTQQAASQRIIAIEERGWVTRRKGPRAQYVEVTAMGKDVLLGEYASFQKLFSPVSEVAFQAEVVSGMGKGQYFLAMPLYREQFRDFLGVDPYEGTLNVKIDKKDADLLSILRGGEGYVIKGFTDGGIAFGAASCFKAKIREEGGSKVVECAIVLPSKSKYWDVVEIISKHHLRRTLKLDDGARVQVVVNL